MTPEDHREVFRSGWNAAIEAALAEIPGGDICRPADVADAIRALRESPDSRPK